MKRGSITEGDKKGLSTIVATLIIILLTLVAVGIIWVVIRNVVEGGAGQIELSQKCLAVELSAVTVNETSSGIYDVTLRRGTGNQEDIGVGDFGELDALGTVTNTVDTNATLTGGDKIEFTAFFQGASGEEQLCSQTKSFEF